MSVWRISRLDPLRGIIMLMMAVTVGTAQGQTTLDSLLERPVPSCREISANAQMLVASAIINERYDSVHLVLDAWQARCGSIEPAIRTRLLLAIHDRTASDSLLSADILDALVEYRQFMTWYSALADTEKPELGYVEFTRQWAAELLTYHSPGSPEYALCEFYGPDPQRLLPMLAAGNWPMTDLARTYKAHLHRYRAMGELHMSLFTGAWLPTGDIAVLGAHPELGFQMGAKKKRMNYDMTIGFRFGSSAEPYEARRIHAADTLEPTSHHFGGHVGLDLGWDLWSHGAHEVQLNAGAGWDGFDAFKLDSDDRDQNASAGSFDLSGGLAYRLYLRSWSYLGLQVKCHWVDYTRNGVVDMTGTPFTIRLIYGGLWNMRKRWALDALQDVPRQ